MFNHTIKKHQMYWPCHVEVKRQQNLSSQNWLCLLHIILKYRNEEKCISQHVCEQTDTEPVMLLKWTST
jgi:hypothetical protein